MGFSEHERREAVGMYRRLGLEVFPYDTQSVPFTGWNNPELWTPAYEHLVDKVHTFGVRLTEKIVVIDVDADRGGSLEAVEDAFGKLPPTLTVVSPSSPRNLHLMFRCSVPLRTNKQLARQFPGVDFLAAGSHVKGATSVRYRYTDEHTMYKLQRPVLDPAPLPAALELAWSETQPDTELDVWDQLVSDSIADSKRSVLSPKEKQNALNKIRDALRKIRKAGDGKRHDVLYNSAREIYQQAILLGRPIGEYDKPIHEAYTESGGSDFGELERNLQSVRTWAATHPIPKPGVTAYHAMQTREIGLWADLATSETRKEDKRLRALIVALTKEATTKLNMTTAASHISGRHPGVGNQQQVLDNLRWLVDHGFLMRNGHGWTEQQFTVPHYRLGRRQ